MQTGFDIVVIGGGHAGIEASAAAARMGVKTALVSMDFNTIGRLSCNPSIGGSAKGHLVKEIDALGGLMGILADQSGIQFKMLNKSKGPAVWSPRAQNDINLYPRYAQNALRALSNLHLVQGSVVRVLLQKDTVRGVVLADGSEIACKAVILCSGTFLNGIMHTGLNCTPGGRFGEQSATGISDMLAAYGLQRGRLKTGTPPRVRLSTIDLKNCDLHPGDVQPEPFSHRTQRVENKIMCYASATNEQTHTILAEGFERSPMFTGRIKGAGPRYCPSIEDKINRFSDRKSHMIVLEPECIGSESIYVNGFSTSLPEDIQLRGLRSIPGMQNVELIRPGYAVEYDFFFPYQLKFTFETKAITGLYFAGQINGTSGYEEAASQGLMAGINAALKVQDKQEFTLGRSEAYIGVLVDDLVNKNTEEPYRIFTSLAEYRLLLRQDNADRRLMKYGYEFGLIDSAAFEAMCRKKESIERAVQISEVLTVKPAEINTYLQSVDEAPIEQGSKLAHITRRGNVRLNDIFTHSEAIHAHFSSMDLSPDVVDLAETEIKYKGYIDRQLRDIERFKANEQKRIPDDINYKLLSAISHEAREKLSKIRPQSLGQASRIAGVSAADISVLTMYLRSGGQAVEN